MNSPTPRYTRIHLDPRSPFDVTDTLPMSEIYAHAAASGELAAFGVNFTGKTYENWRWHGTDGYHDILAEAHPAFVNLTGAEQYLDARQRGFEIPHRAPLTRIFWRHMIHQPPGVAEKTDRGMWRLPPHEYIDNLIIPHGDHLTGWYNVTDCEGFIARHEMRTYALMQAEVLDYGVPKGARFGVFRFSTHNPSAEVLDSGDLDPLLVAVGRNMGHYDDPMVVLTPNAYFDDHNTDGLTNIRRIEQRCIDKFNFRPVIALGEYGYDQGITSEHGWRVAGINGAQVVQRMIDQYRVHLEGYAVCAYGVGFSDAAKVWTFHFDTAQLQLLARRSPRWKPQPPIVIQPPEEPVYPTDDQFKEATLDIGAGWLRLRADKGTTHPTLTLIPHGAVVRVAKIAPVRVGDFDWYPVQYEGHKGWAALLGRPFNEQFVPVELPPDKPLPDWQARALAWVQDARKQVDATAQIVQVVIMALDELENELLALTD